VLGAPVSAGDGADGPLLRVQGGEVRFTAASEHEGPTVLVLSLLWAFWVLPKSRFVGSAL
jgi:hypothetical protein